MSDDEKSFRERVEEIREERERSQNTDDEKSFRERVEEIRKERERSQNDENLNGFQEPQANTKENIQPNIPDMDQFLGQFGKELSGCRIVVETDDTRLEFYDQSLYKTHVGTGPMYQLLGEPDRKEPIQNNTGGRNSTQPTSADTTTKVFTPDSDETTDMQEESIKFCPECGSDLERSGDIQHCPHCGRML